MTDAIFDSNGTLFDLQVPLATDVESSASLPAALLPRWVRNFVQTYVYIIVISGIAGNILCVYFFLRSAEFSRMSVTQYLIALAVSDILFLVSLVFTLLQLHNIQWAHIWAMCDLMMYLTYLSTFLSGWYIMAVTIERAMVVRNPFHACRLQKRRARWVVFWITMLGMLGNLWVIAMVEQNILSFPSFDDYGNKTYISVATCAESASAHQLIFQVMNTADTIISFTVPLVVSSVLNIYIIVKLCRAAKQRAIMAPMRSRASTMETSTVAAHLHRCRSAADPLIRTNSEDGERGTHMPSRSMTFGSSTRSRMESASSAHRISDRRSTATKNTDGSECRITIVLLTVSITYLCLNLPSYAIRVWAAFLPSHYSISTTAAIAEQFCYMLFYTQFAINFVLYSCHSIRSKWSTNTKSDRSLTNYCPRLLDGSREQPLVHSPTVATTVSPRSPHSPRSPIFPNGNNLLQVATSHV